MSKKLKDQMTPKTGVVNRHTSNFKLKSRSTKGNSAYGQPYPWWSYNEKILPSAVFSVVKRWKTQWSLNYIDMVANALRYADRQYNSFYGQSPYIKNVPNQLLSLNVTAACIDTLCSKMTRHTPAVSYITEGGDFLLQEEAEKLEKFMHGLFQDKKINRLTPLVFKDACVLGSGLVHIRQHALKKELVFERPKVYELLFDWNGAMNGGSLGGFHILKFIDRYDLIREYPDQEEDILRAPVQNDILTTAIMNTDTIIVIYSYDMFAKRHTVCIANKCLVDMEWNYVDRHGDPLFPLAVMRYEHDDRGWFGIGLAEKLKAVQNELNKLVRTAQMASHLGAVPKILAPRGSDVTKSNFDNSIGGIVYYSGPTPPTSMPMMSIPTDLFTQIDSFYRRGFEIAGISQLSAGSQKPIGLDSGKALETMYQIESDRFVTLGMEYEDLYIQLNDIVLALYEQLPEMSHQALVQTYYKEDKGQVIKFSDINITRDRCYLKAFPISALPQTPEGQTEIVERWIQMGFIDIPAAKKLIKIPDTEAYEDFETAEYDFVMDHISKMVRGEPQSPVAQQNMPMALLMVTKAYFFYSNQGLIEERLNYLQIYMQTCQRLVNNQQQEAMNAAIAQQQSLNPGPGGGNPLAGGSGEPASPQPSPGVGKAA